MSEQTPAARAMEPPRRARRLPAFKPLVIATGHALPGLALTAAIAGAAYALRQIPAVAVFSPMILAIVIGLVFHNLVGTPAAARSGIAVALRRILRLAVALLGLQLTAQQLAAVGGTGLAIIIATLVATFLATKAVGRLLEVDGRLAELIAAGTSVCGASAVIATNAVSRGTEEDIAYAVACVTLFGTLSMFLYPPLASLLGLNMQAYGLWAGASIHEIAQVVAAAFQHGTEAGQFGTVAKLGRVLLLAPLVLVLGLAAGRRRKESDGMGTGASAPAPWFVAGFVGLVAVNSFGLVPEDAKAVTTPATTFLLTIALAALGLVTDLRKLMAKGIRPFLLGAFSWLFISIFSLAAVWAFY
jgi:uncharacterized integral membrane protein (TIGR00698 family)